MYPQSTSSAFVARKEWITFICKTGVAVGVALRREVVRISPNLVLIAALISLHHPCHEKREMIFWNSTIAVMFSFPFFFASATVPSCWLEEGTLSISLLLEAVRSPAKFASSMKRKVSSSYEREKSSFADMTYLD
ncbi:hypothetical protein Tco_0040408 [Tanacetum coccineum]